MSHTGHHVHTHTDMMMNLMCYITSCFRLNQVNIVAVVANFPFYNRQPATHSSVSPTFNGVLFIYQFFDLTFIFTFKEEERTARKAFLCGQRAFALLLTGFGKEFS